MLKRQPAIQIPMAAQNRNVGLIDSAINKNVQRIAVINLQTHETKHHNA